ncbi:MAG: hypothetical protein QNJ12_14160 [Ilumatobacter sp.]|uniref:hypothetical protein n=1 Tax=Ilumatobacter sp. TaxID=1967498 RepID=UPI002623D769|nr:hypothetical protein [Ilumatobacter sp.]MDJ0769940.1 hypothetical protein [Ilumatobacter sp.]
MATPTTPQRGPKRSAARSVAIAAFGLSAVLVAPAAVSAATASSDAPETSEDEAARIQQRLERLCLRAENVQVRVQNRIERLEGDAETRGSLAWLQARVENAQRRGWEDRGTMLQNRLQIREMSLEQLRERAVHVEDILDRCAELDQ